MTLPALLLLLAAPALWRATGAAPPVVCQDSGPVCLVRVADQVLMLDTGDGRVAVTALPLSSARVAWNLALLRVADGAALDRDRAERARQERKDGGSVDAATHHQGVAAR